MVAPSNSCVEPVRFLIVDDDEISRMAILRAMRKLNLSNPTQEATDGLAALDILRAQVDANGVLPPYIITLDLRMPRMDGHEFLHAIREDPLFARLVVFVLTTSDAPDDVSGAYARHVAGYILKTRATESLGEAIRMLRDYSQMVVLPK